VAPPNDTGANMGNLHYKSRPMVKKPNTIELHDGLLQ